MWLPLKVPGSQKLHLTHSLWESRVFTCTPLLHNSKPKNCLCYVHRCGQSHLHLKFTFRKVLTILDRWWSGPNCKCNSCSILCFNHRSSMYESLQSAVFVLQSRLNYTFLHRLILAMFCQKRTPQSNNPNKLKVAQETYYLCYGSQASLCECLPSTLLSLFLLFTICNFFCKFLRFSILWISSTNLTNSQIFLSNFSYFHFKFINFSNILICSQFLLIFVLISQKFYNFPNPTPKIFKNYHFLNHFLISQLFFLKTFQSLQKLHIFIQKFPSFLIYSKIFAILQSFFFSPKFSIFSISPISLQEFLQDSPVSQVFFLKFSSFLSKAPNFHIFLNLSDFSPKIPKFLNFSKISSLTMFMYYISPIYTSKINVRYFHNICILYLDYINNISNRMLLLLKVYNYIIFQ